MNQNKKIVIVPCSGIGKTYGTVSREAAYEVVEDLRPGQAQLVALSLLVLGDDEARLAVAQNPAIAIDGCKLACASKMVAESGGRVAGEYAVLDVYRRYRQFKPRGIAKLNEGGQQLAHALAESNRLRIFAELMTGDSCNNELKENLGLPPNLLSHHLRVLSEAGLVSSRRDSIDGRWIYYSVDRQAAARWMTWFGEFLDPARIQERIVCGPEGQQLLAESSFIALSAVDKAK